MKAILVTGILCFIAGGIAMGWYMQDVPVIAKPATKILKEPTVTVACKELKVHEQKEKRKVNLPKEIQKNKAIHLADATRINADGHDHVVSALYDADVNTIQLFDAKQPLPWLKFGGEKFIAAHYGFKDDGDSGNEDGTAWQVSAGMDFMQIKALRFGVLAQADNNSRHLVAIGARYVWK